MKLIQSLIAAVLAAFAVQAGMLAGPKNPAILMVVTSHGTFPGSGEKTGLWLEEFAVPYKLFRDAGFDVTVASLKGGSVPVDPRSLQPEAVPNNAKHALGLLSDTRALDQVNPAKYAAVFFPGGHGTMFDFPDNPPVQKTVEYFLLTGRPAAFVCHGPAALVGAVDQNGTPLVKGRHVAAFTDAEEKAVGLTEEVPFLLQTRLESLGADVKPEDNFKEQVVVDGNLVTGQNPASSAETAQKLIQLIKEDKTGENP